MYYNVNTHSHLCVDTFISIYEFILLSFAQTSSPNELNKIIFFLVKYIKSTLKIKKKNDNTVYCSQFGFSLSAFVSLVPRLISHEQNERNFNLFIFVKLML